MIELLAHAKLTWNLEILGRREDGLHDLRSEMTTIGLHDVLFVDDSADHLEVLNPFTTDVVSGEDNLIVRALRLVGRRAGVRVEKSIPVGGGLGGGSADAAAILRWAGGVPDVVAVTLGGDVPFCQHGGRALVEGVGEMVQELPYEERRLTLIVPDFGVSTAQSYRAYDEMRADGWSPSGTNHLEEPAGRVEPRLASTLAWLRAEIGPDVRLAGSGSSMFVEGHLGATESRWDMTGPEGPLQLSTLTTTPK
ncbi:MAG: 4-(cytidine 5'-diphospho)-2-C-methyl-D-erythritol kinase [Acidimicrobiales bacterium]